MPNQDYTAKLLNLEDVIITNVENISEELHIVADPQNRKIIDILPNRYEKDLIKYFLQFESRRNVNFFVCDMNPHFRRVGKICFKNAVVVADRYHVIRQAYWAMERVCFGMSNFRNFRNRVLFCRT